MKFFIWSVESTFLSQIPYEKDRRYIKIHKQWFGLQTYFHISLLTPDIVQNYLPSLTALVMCVYKYVRSNDCYVVYNHIIYVPGIWFLCSLLSHNLLTLHVLYSIYTRHSILRFIYLRKILKLTLWHLNNSIE